MLPPESATDTLPAAGFAAQISRRVAAACSAAPRGVAKMRIFSEALTRQIVPRAGVSAQPKGGSGPEAEGRDRFDISDPILLLNHMFAGKVPRPLCCLGACDANDDAAIDISDAIPKLSRLFLGSSPLSVPFLECGMDPEVDALGCTAFPACD